jgi:N-acetyl-gamma-glutamyl-phosphate reductase
VATVAILGASGYSGQETLDRVLRHPELEVVALGSDSLAGEPAAALDVRLNGSLPGFVANDEALAAGADVVFACLSHDRAALLDPPAGTVVIDLSGAHRLHDAALYPAWYGFEHPHTAALGDWSYAVPELFPPTGPLIANPGCYATAAILALGPLKDAIDPSSVIVDAKSGVSGAGKTPTERTHFSECHGSLSAYGVFDHRHAAEIEQELGRPVTFVPHLVPLDRGILSTIYVRVPAGTTEADVKAAYERDYANAPFVRLRGGDLPVIKHVAHTNFCDIGWKLDEPTSRLIVVSCLDNLLKGAAGQAVQNFNVAFGFDERTGLV